MSLDRIEATIRDVQDFPKPGIVFKDISPVLQDPALFRETIDLLCEPFVDEPPATLVAIDARGFLFGSAMAYKLGCGLTLVRKKGKLPWKTLGISYDLEYGSNEVEIHEDAFRKGDRLVVIDDVLATGGTARAALDLVEKLGGEVIAAVFFMELGFLKGREQLAPHKVFSLVTVD